MLKPRVFIGSSVEGLEVAYAVQQNLLHEAEVTVWDQDVFKLSRTTMESLTEALKSNDFAVFIFRPDDLSTIRKETTNVVRDNVLFEFGLFIGKLGRDRVFFLLPENEELHIPTDLLGITPGRYDARRTDGSAKAATAPVCFQMRSQMKELGIVPGRITAEASISRDANAVEEREWIMDVLEENYASARLTLKQTIAAQSGDDALESQAWVIYCDFKEKITTPTSVLSDFARQHSASPKVVTLIAFLLRLEGHAGEAAKLLTNPNVTKMGDTTVARELARCYVDQIDYQSAITVLIQAQPDDIPGVALELAEVYVKSDMPNEALRVIQRCHVSNPRDKELRHKYARIAQDLELHNVAASLLSDLIKDEPDRVDFWGHLGNTCLQLELPDQALKAYRKAEGLSKADDASQWIRANIGNLLINNGFPTEACLYLAHAVKHEADSEYGHDRLANAIKLANAERKEFDKKCTEGKRQMRELEAAAMLLPPEHPPVGLLQNFIK
ncbi:nucleotide-binding protein [Oxalobacteraceae bacterium OTU3CAMAD1]|nr:nucleotide-binding protein [Oxalobacteraceae bacterium OTU3CAMAD1]